MKLFVYFFHRLLAPDIFMREFTPEEEQAFVQRLTDNNQKTNGYYARALRRLRREHRATWNWAAALGFGNIWFLFHKMFAEFCIFLLGALAVGVLLNIIAVFFTLNSIGISMLSKKVPTIFALHHMPFVIVLGSGCVGIAAFLFGGFFGNTLLFQAAQRREQLGYFRVPQYCATDARLALHIIASSCALLTLSICFVQLGLPAACTHIFSCLCINWIELRALFLCWRDAQRAMQFAGADRRS